MSTPRASLCVLLLSSAWALACANVGDRVEEKVRDVVAVQAERGLARSMGVPRSKVNVEAVGDRFHIETPSWDGDCGLGPDARTPAGFPFSADGKAVADCTVDPDCKDVFGFVCDQYGDLQLVLSTHGKSAAASRKKARKGELEARGWKVRSAKQDQATVLTAMKGKKIQAVAIVSEGDDGETFELLIAPAK